MKFIIHNLSCFHDGGITSLSDFSTLRSFSSLIAFSRWTLSSVDSWATALWASSKDVKRPHLVEKSVCESEPGDAAVWNAHVLVSDTGTLLASFLEVKLCLQQRCEPQWEPTQRFFLGGDGLALAAADMLLVAGLRNVLDWQRMELHCMMNLSMFTGWRHSIRHSSGDWMCLPGHAYL